VTSWDDIQDKLNFFFFVVVNTFSFKELEKKGQNEPLAENRASDSEIHLLEKVTFLHSKELLFLLVVTIC